MNYEILYGNNFNSSEIEDRISCLKRAFFEGENKEAEFLFSSSGRAEILGNHTDHNNGLVMVASITCDILSAVNKSEENVVKIYSNEYSPVIVNLNDLGVNKSEFGTSNSLVRGIAKAFLERGYKIGGFTAYTTSNIFKGAGVSSSAAFEVLVCEIFNSLYNNGSMNEIERAQISQYAENVYFNKPCGLLDQCGISIGSLVKLDFGCGKCPTYEKVNFIKGYSIVITNTGGDHANLTEHYALIRKDMEAIANYFGKKVLRDVDYNDFVKKLPSLKNHFNGRAIMRAMHFYKENERVITAFNSLKNGDVKAFLNAVNESGASSMRMLQNCYVPGDDMQPVALAIETSRLIIKNGAVRVHGGGFAGSILAIVKDDEVDEYANTLKNMFGDSSVFKASIREVGTTIIK
ncbi:MAG: galactokinase [Clostridia bacterium]|nr:galactokinase [Clostridia bacterium]